MDNSRVLIDTSIIIEYFRKPQKEKTSLYTLCAAPGEIAVSTVTVFEVFVGTNPKNEQDTRELFKGLNVISFDEKIAKIASREFQILKQQNKVIELRDLFIGATALAVQIPLATLNPKHSKRLSNITLYPYL
jgi:tRNA(fMet)-specific endonuclease VapC